MQPFLSDTLGLSVFFSSLLSFVLLFIIGYTLIRLFGSMLETPLGDSGLGESVHSWGLSGESVR